MTPTDCFAIRLLRGWWPRFFEEHNGQKHVWEDYFNTFIGVLLFLKEEIIIIKEEKGSPRWDRLRVFESSSNPNRIRLSL